MAYTTIDKPDDYFQTELWSSVDTSIDTINFAPDWVWIKSRSNADTQVLFDTVRGANKRLSSSGTTAEQTTSNELTAFNSNGYTLGTGDNVNRSGHNYVSWNWLGGGTASSNTDGSITSSVSANTTAGFSIVSYTGTGANATVGHGLGVAPQVIIWKKRSAIGTWHFWHHSVALSGGEYQAGGLNSTAAFAPFGTKNIMNGTAPTSTVFSLDTADYNDSSATYISYCFAEKKGYSKFGSYTGNGNANGTFVYTGFKPAWVFIKHTDSAGENSFICDNKREGYNAENNRLIPNLSAIEQSDSPIDILSNGFKARETGNKVNGSGKNYIFMAFAENPFVTSTGICCTAR